MLKATFDYSSQLQTWLQTWLSTRFAARFSTSSCGFATCFRLFLSKTWSRTCCINLDMSRFMQQVRWFVRVLDEWNVEKNPFRNSQRTCWSWIFVTYFIIRAFYHDVIKWRNAMKKLDFTPKNVISCVHNEPALWDRIHRRPSWNYCTYRLISLAFISGSIVLYAYLCQSPIYMLNSCGVFPFLHGR